MKRNWIAIFLMAAASLCAEGQPGEVWHEVYKVDVTLEDECECYEDCDDDDAYAADLQEEWNSDQEPWWQSNKEDTWTTELTSPR